MADIIKDTLMERMSQSELISKIGWNSIKALITSIIIIAGIIKGIELVNFYGLMALAQISLFTLLTMGIYYYYFWSGKSDKLGDCFCIKTNGPLTLKDFFYTERIDSESHFGIVATSWIMGCIIYCGSALAIYTALYCVDNSASEVTMSIMRLTIIFIVSTAIYLYTQRYALRESYFGTIFMCIVYGFALTLSTYLLGMIIGVAGLIFGTIITITVLIFQFSFTSVYTYMDLIQWAKGTHKRIIDEAEREKIRAEKEAEKAKEDALKAQEIQVDKVEEIKKVEESKSEGAQ
jgi:hypothetical protein